MKRPLYNINKRWEMQADTTLTAFRKLNLVILHLRREIHKGLIIFLNYFRRSKSPYSYSSWDIFADLFPYYISAFVALMAYVLIFVILCRIAFLDY